MGVDNFVGKSDKKMELQLNYIEYSGGRVLRLAAALP
jgi:hypothetical protein